MRERVVGLGRHLSGRRRALEDLLLTQQLSPYGVALSRILAGTAYVGILLTNFPARELLFGAASDWARPYRENSEQASWVGLLENASGPVFTAFYLGLIAVGVAFVLGWHTRVAGVLLVLGCVQVLEMNPLVSDQGDNVLRIGICFLLLTECGAHWSLDARRARTRTPRTLPPVVGTTRTLLHNAGVIALAAQLVVIYIAAAMFKIPGVGWKEGTAVAYPLRSDAYQVWPFLNDLATSSAVVVWLVTYGAIFLQLYFPALLLNRVTRRIALAAIIGLHVGIAVLMGLPWFTMAMVAFDGIFVSTGTFLLLERYVLRGYARMATRVRTRVLAGAGS